MERKYDATYKSKKGKAVIHVVAPAPMAAEQIAAGIAEMHRAGWTVWNSLSVEERLRINSEYEKAGKQI